MLLIECKECGAEFDLHSPEKRKVGGLRNHCPSCAEEVAIKYVGLQAADGKQSQATILKFDNEKDKETYLEFWKVNTGLYKGKNGSQIGKNLVPDPKVKFETIVGFKPTNHKGKQ